MCCSRGRPVKVVPVVLCGGAGTRLWPLSRGGFPKQFLCLSGSSSLFQQAVRRVMGLQRDESLKLGQPLVVGADGHRFLMMEQLRELGIEPEAILLEPVGRNTAPAVTLATLQACRAGEDPVLVIVPADQAVRDEGEFLDVLGAAIEVASEGAVAILGVTPDKPETGYGYIKANVAGKPPSPGVLVMDVERFVEKPNFATASRYVDEGVYFWNSGTLVVRASVWLAALERWQPEMLRVTQAASEAARQDGVFLRPDPVRFESIVGDSFDYAVLEHLPGSGLPVRMCRLDAGWTDLGAWEAVWNIQDKDSDGNAMAGDVIAIDSLDNLAHATSRLVGMVGVRGLVVIETPDAVLVADRTRSQDVRRVVAQIEKQQREEHVLHRKVHRPWGWYDCLDEGDRFKVKRIMVRPGASLSLQRHSHRAEHWVVVRGVAEVTCAGKVSVLRENQSTYIPQGEIHRLANPGAQPLEVIEVQSGDYLGEDDIVRFEDDYGR